MSQGYISVIPVVIIKHIIYQSCFYMLDFDTLTVK